MAPFSKLFLLAIAGTLLVDTVLAQATLTRDINTGKADFLPSYLNTNPFFAVGSTLYFGSMDQAGSELWKTNGTSEGTQRVVDLRKGFNSGYLPTQGSLTTQFHASGGAPSNGKFLFVGDNGATGGEIWITDGTEAGTSLVKDIAPGTASSYPNSFLTFQGMVYFAANDGVNTSIWKSDGTPDGTVPLQTVGGTNAFCWEAAQTADRMFFMVQLYNADPSSLTFELWSSDGTGAGTIQLHVFPNFAYNFAVVGDKVFFPFYNQDNINFGNSDNQLWSSDGSVSGTTMVHDFGLASPNNLVPYQDKVIFSNGTDLWVSDGTDAGTTLLYNDFFIAVSATLGNEFYAVGNNFTLGTILLLKSDGTPAGTEPVVDVGASAQQAGAIPVLNNNMLLAVNSAGTGTELGISDGTTGGTILLKDINPGPDNSNPMGFQYLNGKLVFIANDGVHGIQPWITDGTEAGTMLLKDITPGTASSFPYDLQVLGNQVIFSASPVDDIPRTLWKSDAAGTELLSDFGGNGFNPSYLGRIDTVLYYLNSFKLYKVNGLPGSPVSLGDFSSGGFGAWAIGEKTILALSSNNDYEYWVTEGSPGGTEILKDIFPGSSSGAGSISYGTGPNQAGIVRNGIQFIFGATDGVSGFELWTSDGTENGTNLLLDINPGAADSNPSNFVELNGIIYFTADDGVHGRELWKTDGTANGTALLKDIITGPDGAKPMELTRAGDIIFFTAFDPQNGWALWKTDGTGSGTSLVKDTYTGSDNTRTPSKLTAAGTKLFFSADDGHGEEPWVSDGTTEGTFMIEVTQGAGGSFPTLFKSVNGLTYFQAGAQLWRSDGIIAQAELVADIEPQDMTYFNGLMYCSTPSAAYGIELFTVSTKINQTLTFEALPSKSPGDPAFALTSTSTSHLLVIYASSDPLVATVSGNVVTIVGSGTTSITASQAGNDNYQAAADVTQSFTVKANQTVTFVAIPNKTLGDAPFSLAATASSNLPVSYSTTSNRLTLAGSQVTLIFAGRATITAGQDGNDSFTAALPIAQAFCINPPKPTITVSDADSAEPTLTSSVYGGNQWYLNGVAIAGATDNTLATGANGTYKVQAHVDDCVSEFSDDTPLIVTGVLPFESNSVEAYPNPVDAYLQIIGLKDEITGYQLYDMTGRPGGLALEKKDDVYEAQVQHLAQGIYLLRIQQGVSTRQIKFIKN